MKKYFTILLVAILGFVVVSCTRTNDVQTVDNDTYSVVYDLKNQSFVKNTTTNVYEIYKQFNNPIYSSDVILIFRQNGTSNGNPIWQSIPRTLFLTQGELDYDFDFTKADILIKAGGTIDFSTQTQAFKDTYLNGQTFRVVIVPASFGKNANVDLTDYESVIKFYNIDESKVKSL